MTPSFRDVAHLVGTTALAPFVSPVLPGGSEEDQELRDQVRSIARDGDTRLLPVVAGSAGIAALRAAREVRRPVELEELDDEQPALPGGWTPDALTAGEWL